MEWSQSQAQALRRFWPNARLAGGPTKHLWVYGSGHRQDGITERLFAACKWLAARGERFFLISRASRRLDYSLPLYGFSNSPVRPQADKFLDYSIGCFADDLVVL